MKKNYKILMIVSTLLCATPLSGAQISVQAKVGAEIIRPLSLTQGDDGLWFGKIAPHPTKSGSVEVNHDGIVTAKGDATIITTDQTAAHFDVIGESGMIYTISSDETTWITNGRESMFVHSIAPNKMTGLLVNGQDSFKLCGSLDVKPGQDVSNYYGTYNVTIAYE